jgi:hypothetical protein
VATTESTDVAATKVPAAETATAAMTCPRWLSNANKRGSY